MDTNVTKTESGTFCLNEQTWHTMPNETKQAFFIKLVENLLLYDFALNRQEVPNSDKDEFYYWAGLRSYEDRKMAKDALVKQGMLPCEFNEIHYFVSDMINEVFHDALDNLEEAGLITQYASEDDYDDEMSINIIYNPSECLRRVPHGKGELESLIEDTRGLLGHWFQRHVDEQEEIKGIFERMAHGAITPRQ